MARPIKAKWFQPETIEQVQHMRNVLNYPFTVIGNLIGCSKQVARYIYVTKCKQKKLPIMPRDTVAITTVTLPPSVAYVRGLEGYQNNRYRMVQHEDTIRINASNA